jgi:spermidine synthase
MLPITLNRVRAGLRHALLRSVVLHQTRADSGETVQVVQTGKERQLVVNGRTQSVYFPHGNADNLWREYWGHALRPPFPLKPNPRVLILGLGGGTMVHLLNQHGSLAPVSIDVVELSQAVIDVGRRFFGLGGIENLVVHRGNAYTELERFLSEDKKFDLVVQDIFYRDVLAEATAHRLIQSTSQVTAMDGVVVFHNTPSGPPEYHTYLENLERWLRDSFSVVERRIIRNRSRSILFFCRKRANGG